MPSIACGSIRQEAPSVGSWRDGLDGAEHPDSAIDRRATRDSHHAKCSVAVKAPVQAQLFAAGMLAQTQRRLVEKRDLQRLLDLVGVNGADEHERDVGFDQQRLAALLARPRAAHCTLRVCSAGLDPFIAGYLTRGAVQALAFAQP